MTAALKRLRDTEARYQRASRSLTTTKAARDDAIRHAHREGMTTRAIAEHVSVSHQRIAQIVA